MMKKKLHRKPFSKLAASVCLILDIGELWHCGQKAILKYVIWLSANLDAGKVNGCKPSISQYGTWSKGSTGHVAREKHGIIIEQ